ncbi:protein-tyrosine phosphatase-like protein [Rhexocercosporidium sp. MPI-PUGE-AT-0058]|nr:protein-tyrosine phosphatase-like protein [Rhexocercosporidium sp. MPI-PUGE-AT-0058]
MLSSTIATLHSEQPPLPAAQNISKPQLDPVNLTKMSATLPCSQPSIPSTTATEPPFMIFEVMPNLYLSRYPTISLLPDDITYILNMCKDPHDDDCGRTILHIPLDDIDNITPHVSKILNFIETSIGSGGSILVHCALGLNRSVAAILAYLCHVQNVDSSTALTFLRTKKADVKPSALFLKQIDQYFGRAGEMEDPLVGFHRRLQERKKITS